jgi:hypothetical protein
MFGACSVRDQQGSQMWIVASDHERRLPEDLTGIKETVPSVSKPSAIQRALAFNGGMIAQTIRWVKGF